MALAGLAVVVSLGLRAALPDGGPDVPWTGAESPAAAPAAAAGEEPVPGEPVPDRDDATDAPRAVSVVPNPDSVLSRFQRDSGGVLRHAAWDAVPLLAVWVAPAVALSLAAGVASVAATPCGVGLPAALVAPWVGLAWLVPTGCCWPALTSGIAAVISQTRSDVRGPCLPSTVGGGLAGPALALVVGFPVLVATAVLAGAGAVLLGGLARQWQQGGSTGAVSAGLAVAYVASLVLFPLVAPAWMAISGVVATGAVGALSALLYRSAGRPRLPHEEWSLDVVGVDPPAEPGERGRPRRDARSRRLRRGGGD